MRKKTMTQEAKVSETPKRGFKTDPLLWLIPIMMSGLGILMVTSTTSPISFEVSGTPFTMGMRQLQWLGIALAAMIVTYALPIRLWHKMSGFIWLASLFAVVLTLIPGIGTSVGGAHRWLRIAGISIQPTEILILAAVFVVARFASKNALVPGKCFFQVLMLMVVSCIPIMMQPDLGSMLLIMIICMGMYVERFGWTLPLFTGGLGAALLSLFIFIEPYRMRRVSAFLNPWTDPLDTGFQTIQGLIAFANGGAMGSGLGHGFQKLQYLPAAYTDFIYAAIGEELGLLGTLGILLLCFMWFIRCRILYNRVPEGYETSVVWGVALTVLLPFVINIAGVTNLMPLTGMPLPFISYGGSSMVMMWVRVGILLRIYKETEQALAL